MATHNVNDANLQPVEVAALVNADNRTAYETAIRARTLGLNAQNFTDRDNGTAGHGGLYPDVHRSQTANG